MRTTISLDEHLLVEAKKLAAQTGRSLSEVIESAVREALARRRSPRRREPVRLPTFSGNGLQPGVDLDDSASLGDLMDEHDRH